MAIKNRNELFVLLLSNVWQGTERSGKIFQEMSQVVQDVNIKGSVGSSVFVHQQNPKTLRSVLQAHWRPAGEAERTAS